MTSTPTRQDRVWAAVSVGAGLIALNGLVLLLAAVSDASVIPLSFGLFALVLGAFGCVSAWRRTTWAATKRETGVPYREQQRTRTLRPREVVLLRLLYIGTPVLACVVVAVTDRSWSDVPILLIIVPISLATMPRHQREQLLNRG